MLINQIETMHPPPRQSRNAQQSSQGRLGWCVHKAGATKRYIQSGWTEPLYGCRKHFDLLFFLVSSWGGGGWGGYLRRNPRPRVWGFGAIKVRRVPPTPKRVGWGVGGWCPCRRLVGSPCTTVNIQHRLGALLCRYTQHRTAMHCEQCLQPAPVYTSPPTGAAFMVLTRRGAYLHIGVPYAHGVWPSTQAYMPGLRPQAGTVVRAQRGAGGARPASLGTWVPGFRLPSTANLPPVGAWGKGTTVQRGNKEGTKALSRTQRANGRL